MPTNRPRKGVSTLTYHMEKGLTVRLEYDAAESRQSVFLNDRLVSSFICPVGQRGEHTFRSADAKSEVNSYLGDYRVRMAVEENTYKIRYEINRKNAGGSDTKWYWYDRNTEGLEWLRYPDASDFESKVSCTECGEELTCPECDQEGAQKCSECGEELHCIKCDQLTGIICGSCRTFFSCPDCNPRDPSPRELMAFDAVRTAEELELVDSDEFKTFVIDAVGSATDGEMSWIQFLRNALDELGCDTSSVQVRLRDVENDESLN